MRAGLPSDLARLLHDLRGPLNALLMHTQLLAHTVESDPAARDSARIALEQLDRLSAMLTEAFAVAALELGRLGPVDLGAVVAAARPEAGAPVTVAEGPWPSVVGDAALLTLALTHLLRNAVEAGGAGPAPQPPLVSPTVESGETVVHVRDWGVGLRATEPRALIRPWHSTKPGHRGLGLVTAERIARLHGGALRFTALPDGALVALALPAGAGQDAGG